MDRMIVAKIHKVSRDTEGSAQIMLSEKFFRLRLILRPDNEDGFLLDPEKHIASAADDEYLPLRIRQAMILPGNPRSEFMRDRRFRNLEIEHLPRMLQVFQSLTIRISGAAYRQYFMATQASDDHIQGTHHMLLFHAFSFLSICLY